MLDRFFERPMVLTGLDSPELKTLLDTSPKSSMMSAIAESFPETTCVRRLISVCGRSLVL